MTSSLGGPPDPPIGGQGGGAPQRRSHQGGARGAGGLIGDEVSNPGAMRPKMKNKEKIQLFLDAIYTL